MTISAAASRVASHVEERGNSWASCLHSILWAFQHLPYLALDDCPSTLPLNPKITSKQAAGHCHRRHWMFSVSIHWWFHSITPEHLIWAEIGERACNLVKEESGDVQAQYWKPSVVSTSCTRLQLELILQEPWASFASSNYGWSKGAAHVSIRDHQGVDAFISSWL